MKTNQTLMRASLYVLVSFFSLHAWSEESEVMKEAKQIQSVIEYDRSEDCNVEVEGLSRGFNNDDLKIIATHLKSHRLRSTGQAPVEYVLRIRRQSHTIPTLFSGPELRFETEVSTYRVRNNSLELVDTLTKSHDGAPEERLQTSYRSLNAAMALIPTCWDLRNPDSHLLEITHPFGVHLPKTFCLWTDKGDRCVESDPRSERGPF